MIDILSPLPGKYGLYHNNYALRILKIFKKSVPSPPRTLLSL